MAESVNPTFEATHSFAKQLACNDETVRKRTLRRLTSWIQNKSNKDEGVESRYFSQLSITSFIVIKFEEVIPL